MDALLQVFKFLRTLLSDKIIDNLLIFTFAAIVCYRIFGLGWPAGHDVLAPGTVYAAFAETLKHSHGFFILNQSWFCDYPAFFPYGAAIKILLFSCLTLFFGGDFIFIVKLEIFLVFLLSGLCPRARGTYMSKKRDQKDRVCGKII